MRKSTSTPNPSPHQFSSPPLQNQMCSTVANRRQARPPRRPQTDAGWPPAALRQFWIPTTQRLQYSGQPLAPSLMIESLSRRALADTVESGVGPDIDLRKGPAKPAKLLPSIPLHCRYLTPSLDMPIALPLTPRPDHAARHGNPWGPLNEDGVTNRATN